jgi:succinylglutamate desuccinylase
MRKFFDMRKRKSNLNFFKKNSNLGIDYCVKLDSKINGKNILVVCSIHGNEPIGIDYAMDFIKNYKRQKNQIENGSITFLIGNPYAYLENKRYLKYDMNRNFSIKESYVDDLELNRIEVIKKFISENNFDYIIDLHSVSIGNNRILVYEKSDEKSLEIAKIISSLDIHFLFDKKHLPNTLLEFGINNNIVSIAIECGNHFEKGTIKIAQDHINKLLNFTGMIEKEQNGQSFKYKKYVSIDKISVGENFRYLIDEPATELFLLKGTAFAYDDKNGEQFAKDDCYMMVPSRTVNPDDSDAGFLCKIE